MVKELPLSPDPRQSELEFQGGRLAMELTVGDAVYGCANGLI